MFKGAMTALITPFDSNEEFDKEAFQKLIEFQIAEGIDGIVPVGTTGESPTLSHDEHNEVVKTAIETANGKVPVIAGAGSNSTKEAVWFSKHAKDNGADGLLHVSPYYNKPTQEGLFLHFSSIAKSCDLPIIVYNIKGRSGVNIETETLARLAKEHSNIVGVKEASGDLNQMREVLDTLPKDFCVLSGDDNLTYPLMEMGGKGVISVASNVIPNKMHTLADLMLSGKKEEAKKIHDELAPLFENMFIETNPIPIKTTLAWKGMCEEVFRLPMCGMQAENKEKLKSVLTELKII